MPSPWLAGFAACAIVFALAELWQRLTARARARGGGGSGGSGDNDNTNADDEFVLRVPVWRRACCMAAPCWRSFFSETSVEAPSSTSSSDAVERVAVAGVRDVQRERARNNGDGAPGAQSAHRQRPRLPVAFLGGVAVLLLVELLVRAMPPHLMIRHQYGGFAKEAVIAHLHDCGATDVAFVGHSMMRDAVSPPEVRRILSEAGLDATVGNFAVGGANPDDHALVVGRLLAAPRRHA